MSEKEQLLDTLISKLKVLDDTILGVNDKVGMMTSSLDDLKNSYEDRIIELNRQIDLNNDKRSTKVAVILHLFYIDMWDEFKGLISNIHYNTDVYINLVDDSMHRLPLMNFKNKVESEHSNCKIFINENVGLDIGGTLFIIDHILKENKKYDYVLKLHSKKSIHEGRINNKKGLKWKNELIEPILGDYKAVNDVIDTFVENPIIGMIGAKKWLLDKHDNIYQGSDKLESYIKRFEIETDIDNIQFIGGSMFWVRFDIIEEFFTKHDISKILRTFEKNSFTDNKSLRWTHAFERVFGLIVLDSNKKIIGF